MSSERHFLHDLVGPLSTARNTIEILVEELESKGNYADILKRLEPVTKALDKAADLISARRDVLRRGETLEDDQ